MPLRSWKPVELCDRCERRARARCARCRRPLCRRHEPHRDRRCRRCEEEFERRTSELRTREAGTARHLRDALSLLRIAPIVAVPSGLVIGGIGLLVAFSAPESSGLAALGLGGFVLGIVGSAALFALFILLAHGLGATAALRARLRLAAERSRFLRERPGRGAPAPPPSPGDEEE